MVGNLEGATVKHPQRRSSGCRVLQPNLGYKKQSFLLKTTWIIPFLEPRPQDRYLLSSLLRPLHRLHLILIHAVQDACAGLSERDILKRGKKNTIYVNHDAPNSPERPLFSDGLKTPRLKSNNQILFIELKAETHLDHSPMRS